MVWPSRAETVQTTLVVFVVVVVVGIFLWLLDMLLSWLVRFVIG
jgi:preprotein translocase subunit SecE